MGVALFAARKIGLLNAINNLEMMRMQISSQQQRLSDQAMNITMQQMNLQMNAQMGGGGGGFSWKNALGQLTSGVAGAAGAYFGNKYLGNALGQQDASSLGAMLGGTAGSGLASLWGGDGGGGGMQAIQQQNMQMEQERMRLIQQEKRLEMVAKQLETQLAMKNKELEGVEKGEQAAIQRSGPKYAD